MKSATVLPRFFKPLFWSYDFSVLNPAKDKETIILNTINYGELKHWQWVAKYYGKETIREVLSDLPGTAIRPPAGRLAAVLFDIKNFKHAPRGVNNKGAKVSSPVKRV